MPLGIVRYCDSKVSQENNTIALARLKTRAISRVERTTYMATAASTAIMF